MRYVADANTFLAVVLDEPEKSWLIEATKECELLAPSALPYEIANALSALAKRRLLDAAQTVAAWDAIGAIAVELVDVDVRAALALSVRCQVYAYDALYLQCALASGCPLLTLDRTMRRLARDLNIQLLEQP